LVIYHLNNILQWDKEGKGEIKGKKREEVKKEKLEKQS